MDFLLPSFTPVRRPENSVNNRVSGRDLQKEWTANRCHRLLRPLTSRIAILDKQMSCFPCANHVSKRQRRSGSIPAMEECHDEEDPEASDAEWTHQPARKRIRRTYSTRRGGKDKSNHGHRRRGPKSDFEIAAPGEITVPTPVLNRTSKNINTVVVPIEEESFRVVKRSKPRCWGQDGEAYSQLAHIRKTTAASRYSTYEGIFNGLEALLKATAPNSLEKKKTGISSLFLTCLKTIPIYIAEEQAIMSAEAESTGCKSAIDRRDISSEIYDDLESLGTSNLGWKHLKTVVRSHGIKVVSDAIERRLLDVQCCGALVTLCVQLDSLDAAESILSSILSVSQIPNPKTVHSKFGDDTAAQAVSMLWRFVELTGRTSFQYRQLSRMFATGLLPLVWLATKEFGPIWTGVIQSLSSGPDSVDALAFINTTLPLLARPELVQKTEWHGLTDENKDLADALQQTYSSVLTTISTIAILSREAARKLHTGDSHANFEPSTPEHDAVVTLLHDCIVSCKLSFQEPSNSSALLLVSILAIVSGDKGIACGSYAFLIDLLLNQLRRNGSGSGLSSAYSGIVTFICSIARCCGRGASTSGLEYLQQLHRILEAPRSSNALDESDLLIEIIVDSAFAFAQQAPDRKHLTYAEDINTRYHQGCNPQTKEELAGNPHTGNNGFRWEEGISEWVTATPAANLKKSKLIGHYDSLEESECDTPFRPIYKKARRENVLQTKSTRATRSLQHKVFLDSEDDQEHLPKVASSDSLMEPIALVSPPRTSSQTTHSDRGYISSGNKRKLPSSRTFQILEDDSDDELSFLSSASQEDRKVLRVVTNTASTSTRRLSQAKSWMTQSRSTIRQRVPVLEDSEDELCI